MDAVAQSPFLPGANRRTDVYKPTTWDYHSLQQLASHPNAPEERHVREAEGLKVLVRSMILGGSMEPLARLELIDTLHRLGLKYQFESEMKEALFRLFRDGNNAWWVRSLHATALRFRLLRHNLIFVPQDVFEGFRDDNGAFRAELVKDVRGLLSLYEASFLGWEGEFVLDEANSFATAHLSSLKEVMPPCPMKRLVEHALDSPLHWSAARFEARWFIGEYQKHENRNPALLRLAKLDFNIVQSIHQKELGNLAKWWVELGSDKLHFLRGTLIQNFMWGCAMSFEPQYSKVREAAAKQGCFITMIDDIYDFYGTPEEQEIITNSLDRWDVQGIQKLPHNISLVVLAAFNCANQIGYDLLKDQDFNGIPHIAKAWGTLCKAYLKEAKWLQNKYCPTLDEYLENGTVSISFIIPLITAYLQTEASENLTYEAADHVNSVPPLLRYSSLLNRLHNDLGTSSAEIARGDNWKSVQCYMSETRASEEVSREHIIGLIHKTWKSLNKCMFEQTTFSEPFVSFNSNTVRGSQFFFQREDGYGNTETWQKDLFLSVLIQPISLQEC